MVPKLWKVTGAKIKCAKFMNSKLKPALLFNDPHAPVHRSLQLNPLISFLCPIKEYTKDRVKFNQEIFLPLFVYINYCSDIYIPYLYSTEPKM